MWIVARKQLWLRRCLGFSVALWLAAGAQAAEKWTEYNLGPFYVDTNGDAAAARFDLTQLEQARWVMSGLLEIKDLNATWPFRILVTNSAKPTSHFVLHDGYYLLVTTANARMPLGEVARMLLDSNTPRLPEEAERGVAELFDTVKANGSRVTWGGPPMGRADMDFARMQLFATKFEYGASFHIFLSSLRNGSTVHAAEHNAYGLDYQALEREAAARLAANDWQAVATSGRPLDPKRDFGDHSLEDSAARAYATAAQIDSDRDGAEAALKNMQGEGGQTKALVMDALADVAVLRKENADELLKGAMDAGSRDAAIYAAYANDMPPQDALPILKKAQLLNPYWAEPVFQQAMATEDLKERQELMKRALKMNPRATDYWVALARLQTENGQTELAAGSWSRAEDSAPDETRRKAVEQMRDSMETARLDASEADKKRERDSAVLADQKAQQAEADRIRAAEEKANKANSALSQGSSGEVVDYGALVKTERVSGSVVAVDCKKNYTRVTVRDANGKTRQLLYLGDDPEQKVFSCAAKAERRVVIRFRPQVDKTRGTEGEIVSVQSR